jgi:hypothetical protein
MTVAPSWLAPALPARAGECAGGTLTLRVRPDRSPDSSHPRVAPGRAWVQHAGQPERASIGWDCSVRVRRATVGVRRLSEFRHPGQGPSAKQTPVRGLAVPVDPALLERSRWHARRRRARPGAASSRLAPRMALSYAASPSSPLTGELLSAPSAARPDDPPRSSRPGSRGRGPAGNASCHPPPGAHRTVSRSTSSKLVIPWRIFSSPLARRVSIPSSSAFLPTAVAPTTTDRGSTPSLPSPRRPCTAGTAVSPGAGPG